LFASIELGLSVKLALRLEKIGTFYKTAEDLETLRTGYTWRTNVPGDKIISRLKNP